MEHLAPQQGPRPGPAGRAPVVLTAVYFLQREVLLQVPPELHLIAILAHSAIIGQDEVGVHAVECGEFAEGVAQGLVQAHHLRDSEDKRRSELEILARPTAPKACLCPTEFLSRSKSSTCYQGQCFSSYLQ